MRKQTEKYVKIYLLFSEEQVDILIKSINTQTRAFVLHVFVQNSKSVTFQIFTTGEIVFKRSEQLASVRPQSLI